MNYVIGMLLGVVLVVSMVMSKDICAQVGPCEIITIIKPDGRIKNCTVCGTIVSCR
jgi:hypothetical protein